MTTDDKYWANYDGLQHAKHAILMRYLGGWFPKLTSAYSHVLYIDCHAGRGKHDTGEYGSPIIALKGLLNHRSLNRILNNSQVNFIFFEKDEKNYNILQNEIKACGKPPDRVNILTYCSDYEPELHEICEKLRAKDEQLAPCFAFLDPFGFGLSMDLMNMLLSFPRSELFINFMFRYVDMAIRNETQEENMNRLFGTQMWKNARTINDYSEREQFILNIFSSKLSAKYITPMQMLSSTNTTKYVLIHATNHQSGRDLMKQAVWSVSPEGYFAASEKDDPNQLILLKTDPDLFPLKRKLLQIFRKQTVSIQELHHWLRGEIYLDKHLHMILRELRDNGEVIFQNYEGRFAFKKNPDVKFL